MDLPLILLNLTGPRRPWGEEKVTLFNHRLVSRLVTEELDVSPFARGMAPHSLGDWWGEESRYTALE